MSFDIAFVLALVLAASLVLISDRLRPDVVALTVLVVLGLSGLVPPAELFSGFSRSAVITIMALFIITAGLERTGATRLLGRQLGRLAGPSEARTVFVLMVATALLSLVMNTIAAAAVLLPVAVGHARQVGLRPSRLLIPLAFASLLGGMATLFTTANLLVSGVLVEQGYAGYGVLDFLPVGLPMAVVGIAYMTLAGRRWLPSRHLGGAAEDRPVGSLAEAYGMNGAISAAYVKPGSSLAGLSLAEGQWGERLSLNVVGISRGAQVNLMPASSEEVLEGDVVLFTGATADEALNRFGLVRTDDRAWGGQLASDQVSLLEVTLAPRSEFAGRTLRELRFGEKYDVRALALWREGNTLRESLADVPLRFGDALLLQGRRSKLQLLREERGLLVLVEEDMPAGPVPVRTWLALGLTALGVTLPALGLLPIAEATFGAAVLMVLLGCLDMSEAYAAIEWKAIFLIAGMLPLGTAMTSTGAAAYLGNVLVQGLGRLGPLALAGGLFVATLLLTQVMSGQVTPLVLAPIAMAAAQQVGADPRGIGMAVALGASMGFLTPISHSTNLLVMGPGGYRFGDYARVGWPLSLLLFGVLLAGLALFWGIR